MALYSDINTSKQNKVPKVYDIDSVWQSFSNFMKTRKRQRFFRPELGHTLNRDLLFELAYEEAIFYATSNLLKELRFWDPRIEIVLNRTDIDIDYDNQVVKMKIAFRVRGFGNQIVVKELDF